MSGTWATTASWSSPARSRTRPSPAPRAVSTARRSWSVTRARVMTAPGSTVAGSSARGRRVADVVARVAHASKGIDASPALIRARLSFVGSLANASASSQLTALGEELAVRHHEARAVDAEHAPQPAARGRRGRGSGARRARRRPPRRCRRRRRRGAAEELDAVAGLVAPEERHRRVRRPAFRRRPSASRLRAAAAPCSAALVQCSTRISSPNSALGQRAMSPAA